jgi:glycosyltransferase involved in cell wall biosynthesis
MIPDPIRPKGTAAAGSGAPAISVIVPAYGLADLVGEALASLQRQSFADWEAVVVDDGDAAVEPALIPFRADPRIRLIHTDHAGPGGARNQAAAAARAPIFAFLDGDDLYEPDYLATMLEAIGRDPALGFVTCDAWYFGRTDRVGKTFSSLHPQTPPITLAAVLGRDFNVFIGSTVRRIAFEAVAGFDPELFHAEDFDLWIRLLAAGWGAAAIHVPLVQYRRREGSLSTEAGNMRNGAQRVYEKALGALAGRPEAAVAQAMLDDLDADRDFDRGEALILAGQARAGVALLRGPRSRSPRWRVALPVLRMFPALAGPLMRLRPSLPPPRR